MLAHYNPLNEAIHGPLGDGNSSVLQTSTRRPAEGEKDRRGEEEKGRWGEGEKERGG